MEDFPDVLRAAATAEGLTPDQRALIAAPELAAFWLRLAAHVPALVARGWSNFDAAAALVGAVLTPLALGHDARARPRSTCAAESTWHGAREPRATRARSPKRCG